MKDITGDILSRVDMDEPVDNAPQETEEVEQVLEAESSEQEAEQVEQKDAENQVEEHNEPPQKKSWRELREKAERAKQLERERDEALRMIEFMQKNMPSQQPQKQQVQHEEEEFNIDALPDDEYTDNKQLKRILKQQQKYYKKIESDMQKNQKQTYVQTVESRIRTEFPDYKDVVSDENIARLRDQKPHIFKSLSYNPDLYEQAVGAYEAIRDFGIYKPNNYAREDKQLQRNVNKPRPSAALSPQKKSSPLDNVSSYEYGLSKDDADRIYADTKKKAGWGMY